MDWPIQDEQFSKHLIEVLRAGKWAGYNSEFTKQLGLAIGQAFEREQVQLCCSGTLGIELALRGLFIQPGAQVVVCGYDYPGNFRSIEMVGATPVLIDVSAGSWSLTSTDDLHQIEPPFPKAIIVSHLHGSLANMPAICQWAAERQVFVVEDACQVPGAYIAGKPAGAWGDVSVLSFGGTKLLTAGRGGAVMTNSARIAQRMTVFRDRGNDAFALSEIQAAVLLPQMEQLSRWHHERRVAAQAFQNAVADLDAIRCSNTWSDGWDPAFYKLGVFIDDSLRAGIRESFIDKLTAAGVRCGAGFPGFLSRPKSRCLKPWPLENCRKAVEQTVVIHHTELIGGAAAGLRLAEIFRSAIAELDANR